MKNQIKKTKGFTLLEILVATVIFSSIMVITSSVVSQSAGYQNKLKSTRETTEETRKISDLLSRDIRVAADAISLKTSVLSTVPVREYQNGIILLSCDETSLLCSEVNYTNEVVPGDNLGPSGTNDTPSNYMANALILKFKDHFQLYFSANKIVYSKELSTSDLASAGFWSETDQMLYLTNNPAGKSIFSLINLPLAIISADSVDETINFAGYAATKSGPSIQSYVLYYIHAQTKDFQNIRSQERSESFIRSMVTSRNYSI